ncbi:hypothetical protein [Bacillus sp. FJAT-45350]|uniref:hypothetical protein n=1 Tax=Bacillus sp. FJAT-45350 TaxID=2011014 RepID=UPI000BB7A207|nr:hypothetical protein [Bacillus sp. FJAT-45350]
MRTEIRQRLIDGGFERVYEPAAAGPQLKKPYLVVQKGAQDAGDPYANFTTIIEIWPCVKQETFQLLDIEARKTIKLLNKRFFEVNGESHYIEYLGTNGEDTIDDSLKVLTRGLRFQVFSLAWLNAKTTDPDPISALQNWTTRRFSDLQIHSEGWQPSDAYPALYWRFGSITSSEPMNWGVWLNVRIHGHLIMADTYKRTQLIKDVVQQLAIDKRTALEDKSTLEFLGVSADSSADPFRAGQITLSVRFGVIKTKEFVEKINHFGFEGGLT